MGIVESVRECKSDDNVDDWSLTNMFNLIKVIN